MTGKEGEQVRGTHNLGSIRGWDSSGQQKRASERARGTHALGTQREGQLRTAKKDEQARDTHILRSTEGKKSQDSKRKAASEENSLAGERRWRDISGQRKGRASEGHSPT